MTYTTLALYNLSQGPEILVCFANDVTSGVFMAFLLLSIWTIMTIGSFMVQKKTTGFGDFPVAMSLGSFTELVFVVLMRLVTCPYQSLASDMVLAVSIGMMFISVLFLLFSRD
jgi:prepilin signal peptidase PulO-like enzyme (type II secretory pathway)